MNRLFVLAICLIILTACGEGSSPVTKEERYFFKLGENRTYYYERIGKVLNGQKLSDSGDGHYITITPRGIYESDDEGNTKNLGFMKKVSSDDTNRTTFEGNGFLGKGLKYVINNDCSRLNILVPDGTIYVYASAALPNDNQKQRHYNDQNANIPATPSGIPANDFETPLPSSPSPVASSGKSISEKKRYECPICHGVKRIAQDHNIGVTSYGVGDVVYVTCHECGKRYDKNGTDHKHVICTYCKGRGYQEID